MFRRNKDKKYSPYTFTQRDKSHIYHFYLSIKIREKEIEEFKVECIEYKHTWRYWVYIKDKDGDWRDRSGWDSIVSSETGANLYSEQSCLREAKAKICMYMDENYIQVVKSPRGREISDGRD